MNDSTDTGFGIVHRSLRGRLTPVELAVYVALSWRVDGSGYCWPSYATIATDAGISKRTAMATMRSLEDKGLVLKAVRKGRDGGQSSNGYRLMLFIQQGGVLFDDTGGVQETAL